MGRFDLVSILICLLAVVGLYFLLCKIFGAFVGRHFTIGIRAEDYEDGYDVLCAWHTAQIKASSQHCTNEIPVVLFEGTVNMRTFHLLRDEGIPVYHKMTD